MARIIRRRSRNVHDACVKTMKMLQRTIARMCCVLRRATAEVVSTFLVRTTHLVAFTSTTFCLIQGVAVFCCPFHWNPVFQRVSWNPRGTSGLSLLRGVDGSLPTGAVHSPVLKISMHIGGGFACTLADKQQPMHLMMLRFHLGTQASNLLLSTPDLRRMLDTNCVGKLNDFLRQLGNRSAPERTYALLGQSYLSRVMYCQINDVALALSEDFDGTENIIHIMGRYIQKLVPLVEAFEVFHDLEDNDGDEDEEEYRLSWDLAGSDDDIEELDDR